MLERRQEKTKKSLKIVMFESQVCIVNRSQDLEKKKKEHSCMYLTVLYMVCSMKLSLYIYIYIDKRAKNDPV